MTIDSLKKPIDYIREIGLEKDFGRIKVYINVNALYINPDFCILFLSLDPNNIFILGVYCLFQNYSCIYSLDIRIIILTNMI